MKPVSISARPGGGGMVQVAGTSPWAKVAIRILKEFDCPVSGWSVTGSKGERIYTYEVSSDVWSAVRERLDRIDDELQMKLFA